MSAPTIDKFPVLGFVPCPGDYETVKKTASTIRATSDALGEISRVLRGADKGDWRGKAAEAFRALLADDFRPKVDDAYKSFDQAKDVIRDWAEYMLAHQKIALRLEEEASEAEQATDSGKSSANADPGSTKTGEKPDGPIPSKRSANEHVLCALPMRRRGGRRRFVFRKRLISPQKSQDSGTSWELR
ncbi:putative T7SS-secreted protein [Streptomyces sp. NPDC051776]|uniref:putative T7SS-secreted protein n=1 Tax=Streptomyces sp. NPDC051776 TaxID=3155414 RepID=UPI003421C467